MSVSTGHFDAEYFDGMYRDSEDPWQLGGRWYEQRKYAATLAALRRRRYRSAFEPGCSVGVLTAQLAHRCERLLAVDGSEKAVQIARDRLAARPNVTVRQWSLPSWPEQSFDLIVLSEVGYYLSADELSAMTAAAVSTLEPGGDLACVHWRHPVAGHRLSGDAVQACVAAHPNLDLVVRHEEEDFLLEVFARTPPAAESVAGAEGLC